MSIAASLLPEFDAEMANTRKVLERLPEDQLDWRAAPKSNTIGWVATHLANIPSWNTYTFDRSELDLEPPDGTSFKTQPATTRAAVLALFDKNAAAARQALVSARDEQFAEPWTLLKGGQAMFTMPKGAVYRMFVMNHMIHHRAILCAYYRMVGVPVPGMYGPSGDE